MFVTDEKNVIIYQEKEEILPKKVNSLEYIKKKKEVFYCYASDGFELTDA